MNFHSEILIFELLKLRFIATGSNETSYQDLENAFYKAQTFVNEKDDEDGKKNYNFQTALSKLLKNFPDYFTLDNQIVYLESDPSTTFNMFLESFDNLSETDFHIGKYIMEIPVYRALNLPVNMQNIEAFLTKSEELLNSYRQIAKNELSGLPQNKEITKIKAITDFFDNSLASTDEETYIKLKIFIDYLNFQLKSNSDEPFKDTSWNIILFEAAYREKQQLQYAKLEVICSIIGSILEEQSEALIDEYFDFDTDSEVIDGDIYNEANPTLGEIPLFLTFFIIYLNRYIKTTNIRAIKDILTTKKYLLLSTTELGHVEEYFLDHQSLDDLELPDIAINYKDAFQLLKPKVFICLNSLCYSDKELENNPSLLTKNIINIIFIKCFLTLSLDESAIKTINLLLQVRFYTNSNYQITANLIKDIISNDSLSHGKTS